MDATPKLTAKELEVYHQALWRRRPVPDLEVELEQRGTWLARTATRAPRRLSQNIPLPRNATPSAVTRCPIRGSQIENEAEIVLPQWAKQRELLQVEEPAAAAGDDT